MKPISDELKRKLKDLHAHRNWSKELESAKYRAESRGYWRGLGVGFVIGLVLGVFWMVVRLGGAQ